MSDKSHGMTPKTNTPTIEEPSKKEPGTATEKEATPLGEPGKPIQEGAVTGQQVKSAERAS